MARPSSSNKSITLTAEQLELTKDLTHLNRMTVINVVSGMSYRDAYRAAGGSARTEGAMDSIVSRMLSTAKVKAFYDSIISSAASDAILSRDEALKVLTVHARTDEQDIAYLKNAQTAIKQISDMEGWQKKPEGDGEDKDSHPLNITFEVRDPVSEVKITNAKPE